MAEDQELKLICRLAAGYWASTGKLENALQSTHTLTHTHTHTHTRIRRIWCDFDVVGFSGAVFLSHHVRLLDNYYSMLPSNIKWILS